MTRTLNSRVAFTVMALLLGACSQTPTVQTFSGHATYVDANGKVTQADYSGVAIPAQVRPATATVVYGAPTIVGTTVSASATASVGSASASAQVLAAPPSRGYPYAPAWGPPGSYAASSQDFGGGTYANPRQTYYPEYDVYRRR